MARLEGPVVDCLWDTFLVSWHNAMSPPPPCLDRTAASLPVPCYEDESFRQLFNAQGQFRVPEEESPAQRLPEHKPNDPHYDDSLADEIRRMHSWLSPQTEGETPPQIIARHLSTFC